MLETPRGAATFASLNHEQHCAATWHTGASDALPPRGIDSVREGGVDSGPLLIIAGAGTGKTNTLAHRVAYLLLSGVAPQRILLMTFSRRAAAEMLLRASLIAQGAGVARVGQGGAALGRQLWSGTFHAIGNRLLRHYARALGLSPDFSILDRGDAADLIDMQRSSLGFSSARSRFPRKDTCLAIYSHRVNTGNSLEDTLSGEYPWCSDWAGELKQLFRLYVETKQNQQLLDYDDLLLYWHLLMQQPEIALEVGERFDHVLVDEYQDTNRLQAEILLAMKPAGDGLCVVGDDAQSIYSFRAADVDNILSFPQRFTPPATVVALEHNYRSVQPILDAANALMEDSSAHHEKQLRSDLDSGQKPVYVQVEDDVAQAQYVVEEVLARREEGVALREQAVLMRKSQDSDVLEVELARRDIPFVKYGGLKFLEAAHVKDVLGVLRFADNPRYRIAGFRTLQLLAGMGPAHAERCLIHMDEHGGTLKALENAPVPAAAREDWPALVDLLTGLAASRQWAGQLTLLRTWYEPQLERLHGNATVRSGDLAQLEALAERTGSRERFLSEMTLDPPQASGDESDKPHKDEDYLILSTVHSAKGQEWDSVYTLNVVDGTFPNEFATESAARLEEERRLLYVAMTRAKRRLALIAPLKFYVTQQRRFGERHVYGARSRFLTEPVLATLEQISRTAAGSPESPETQTRGARVDAGAQVRSMWND